MAVKVEQIPGQPIIIATLSGDITTQMVHDMFAQSARLVDQIGGTVYRITDIRQTEISFPELVQVLADSAKGQPGSPTDPRIRGMIVGTHGWSHFFVDSAEQDQYGTMKIPIFESLEDAFASIYSQMRQE